MGKEVSIIDYGMSNLLSISRAFEHVGATVHIIEKPEEVRNADYLVLPGVGAFPDGMKELEARNLVGPIQEYAASGRPLMGVCLGMQMLLTRGFEYIETNGLGLIKGEVLPLPRDMKGFKVPNINWHRTYDPGKGNWKDSIFRETENGACFYFVHSYYAKPDHEEDVLATSQFGDLVFAAAVKRNNVSGTQFHPEKSGDAGLELLKNFMDT